MSPAGCCQSRCRVCPNHLSHQPSWLLHSLSSAAPKQEHEKTVAFLQNAMLAALTVIFPPHSENEQVQSSSGSRQLSWWDREGLDFPESVPLNDLEAYLWQAVCSRFCCTFSLSAVPSLAVWQRAGDQLTILLGTSVNSVATNRIPSFLIQHKT